MTKITSAEIHQWDLFGPLILLENPNVLDDLGEANPALYWDRDLPPNFMADILSLPDSCYAKQLIARNPALPLTTLQELARSEEPMLLNQLVSNEAATEELLLSVLDNPATDWWVAYELIDNPVVTHKALEAVYVKYDRQEVRKAILWNSRCPEKIIKQAFKDEHMHYALSYGVDIKKYPAMLNRLRKTKYAEILSSLNERRLLSSRKKIKLMYSKNREIRIHAVSWCRSKRLLRELLRLNKKDEITVRVINDTLKKL